MKGMKGICKERISATWPLGEKSPGEDRIALDGKMLHELETMMGEWGMFVLEFEVGSPWVMTRFNIWPKMVAEQEVVLDEEIKSSGKQTSPLGL